MHRLLQCNFTRDILVSPRSMFRELTVPGTRGIKTFQFGGAQQTIFENTDYGLHDIQDILGNKNITILGYDERCRDYAWQLTNKALSVSIGSEDAASRYRALQDGFIESETLFPIKEAIARSNIIMDLSPGKKKKQTWDVMKPLLTKGKTLCVADGTSIVYGNETGIIPPKEIDVIMITPQGIAASVAIYQDVSKQAIKKAYCLAIGIGAKYMYGTTFENEVLCNALEKSDILNTAVQDLFHAMYGILRKRGHPPLEAYNTAINSLRIQDDHSLFRGSKEMNVDYNTNTLSLLEALYDKIKDDEKMKHTFHQINEPALLSQIPDIRLAQIQKDFGFGVHKKQSIEVLDQYDMWRVEEFNNELK
jgi:ketol-acid reductoisomerase